MKRLIIYSGVVFLCAAVISCSKSDSSGGGGGGGVTTTGFTATINSASEVPSNPSTATGSATGSFNNSTKVLTLTITYTGVTATDAHIHQAAAGVSGPILFPLTIGSPISYTSAPLTVQQETDLKANLLYVNIHSVAYSAGEIRGQIIKQ